MPIIKTSMYAGLTVLLSATLITTVFAQDTETRSPHQTLIRNVSIWDGTSDKAIPNQDLLVEGHLIKAIGRDMRANGNAEVIDGQNLLLMPGIIDAHTHLASPVNPLIRTQEDSFYIAAVALQAARLYLMRGWTTMRDVGGPSQGLGRAIDAGHAIGPRVYPSAATISQTAGHGDRRGRTDPHPNMTGMRNPAFEQYSRLADGPDEVRRAVRESLRQGAVQIKLTAGGGISSDFNPLDSLQFSLEELEAAVEAASDWNTYVTVHAYTDGSVNRALDAGVKVIEHGHLLTEPTLRRIKKDGAYLSSQSFGFVREMMTSSNSARARKSQMVMDGVDAMMTTAKRIGLPVAFGTDTFGSLETYQRGIKEFTYRKRWFDSLEILKQATSHNAKLLELTGLRNPYPDGPLGVIVEGAYADLLLVEGDPLSDASILENYVNTIKLIMKDGYIYKNTVAP
ncbi:MAG: amidohydrolase family protein [Rhodospirillaceae bacterium]|nr:amidohydrolase family protein [Rhodospirillaceae bacterium]